MFLTPPLPACFVVVVGHFSTEHPLGLCPTQWAAAASSTPRRNGYARVLSDGDNYAGAVCEFSCMGAVGSRGALPGRVSPTWLGLALSLLHRYGGSSLSSQQQTLMPLWFRFPGQGGFCSIYTLKGSGPAICICWMKNSLPVTQPILPTLSLFTLCSSTDLFRMSSKEELEVGAQGSL